MMFTNAVLMAGTVLVLAAGVAAVPAAPREPEGHVSASAAKPGKIVFARHVRGSGDSERRAIYVIRSDGTGLRKLTMGVDPKYSADGKRIVFARRGEGGIQSIYTMTAKGTKIRRITSASTLDTDPAWSPDGKRIVFARGKKESGVWPPDPSDIYTMTANGKDLRRLTKTPDHEDVPDWSPNGKRIAYANSKGIVTIKPNGKGKRFLGGGHPDWSPNGKRIAFNQDMQIWVMRADGTAKRAVGPVTFPDKNNPAWSPNSKRFAFVGFYPPGGSGDGDIGIFTMRVDGTHIKQLTVGGKQGDFGTNDTSPDWQPR